MFGIVFALFMALAWYFAWPTYMVVGITVALLFFQYLISPLLIGWIYRIDWMSKEEVKRQLPHLHEIIKKVCQEHKIKYPRFGLIHDGNPNAFTFGWTKNSARLVITTGILDLLDEREQKAVVGHELGHVVHNDFVVMTFVSAIPVVCYAIYQGTLRSRRFSRVSHDNEKGAAAIIAVGVIAYIAYLISQFLALMVSRIREYWADNFSAQQTGDPGDLSMALVKIAYGLARSDDVSHSEQKEKAYSRVHAAKALGIFDRRAASILAFTSLGASGVFSPDTIQKAAAWDLRNPWARYYELFSTHPLPAKRIRELNKTAEEWGLAPRIDLTRSDEVLEQQGAGKTLVDEFVVDLFFYALPLLIFLGLVGFTIWWIVDYLTAGRLAAWGIDLREVWAVGIAFVGLAMVVKTRFKYGGGKDFKKATVSDLVSSVKVSPIRPIPCKLEGKLIGRGVPGLVFSEDMVLQDSTGFITLDYDIGIGFINTLFAIFKVDRLVGRRAKVKGWYRRAPVPYVQIDRIWVEGQRFRNFKKHLSYALAFFVCAFGLAMLIVPLIFA
ncbi:MAG: hypothetical protein Kow0069_23390 [Promethearchaeota archaeon]